MAKTQFCIVQGTGPDTVGLIGKITAPIAAAQGNIIDLRQDVLHSLFTIYLVVDLGDSSLTLDSLRSLVAEIGSQTGLQLTVEPYTPVPRSSDKRNLLMILIGRDRPGIIGTSSEMLGKYDANIEFAKTIGREGIFLMELLTDISRASIPLDNLKRTLSKNMEALGIKTVFQDEHVFNKRKRVILFDIATSFLDAATRKEILDQTGITAATEAETAEKVASHLEGLPLATIDAVLKAITPSPATLELIQTLKTMGYKVGLVSTGMSFFTDHLKSLLDIDYAFGSRLEVDDDTCTLVGELATEQAPGQDIAGLTAQVAALEQIAPEDITVITGEAGAEPAGIRLDFQLNVLLDLFNQRVLSKRNLIGLLASFGIPARD